MSDEYGNSSSGGAPELLQARVAAQLQSQPAPKVPQPDEPVSSESIAPPAPPVVKPFEHGAEELSELEVMPDAELLALAKLRNVVVENAGDRSSVLAALVAAGIKSASALPNPVPPAPPALPFTFGASNTEA
jgi:hypothetical protein